jgi:hypothetical protein
MPKPFARRATFGSFMSNTDTSQDGHAMSLTMVIASSHAGHPALKTSTVRFVAIVHFSCRAESNING